MVVALLLLLAKKKAGQSQQQQHPGVFSLSTTTKHDRRIPMDFQRERSALGVVVVEGVSHHEKKKIPSVAEDQTTQLALLLLSLQVS